MILVKTIIITRSKCSYRLGAAKSTVTRCRKVNDILTLVHKHTHIRRTNHAEGVTTLRTLLTFGTESLEGDNYRINNIASKCEVIEYIQGLMLVIHVCMCLKFQGGKPNPNKINPDARHN